MATKRAKPVATKAGAARNPKRRYSEGGRLSVNNKYKCGGKLK